MEGIALRVYTEIERHSKGNRTRFRKTRRVKMGGKSRGKLLTSDLRKCGWKGASTTNQLHSYSGIADEVNRFSLVNFTVRVTPPKNDLKLSNRTFHACAETTVLNFPDCF